MTEDGPRLSSVARRLAATYFTFDPRSLGLFRIVLGAVMFADLSIRYQEVDFWFTDEGFFPREALRGLRPPLFSIFLYVSTREGAVALMALCAIVYACFTAGLATRVAHVLALVCVVSLNSRVHLLENGGNYVLNLLTTWTLFLPLGRRFSIDAWLRARRRRKTGKGPAVDLDRPVWSFAVLALLLQFAVIYTLNVLHKTGPRWEEGSAVHYALQDERMITAFGVWLRELPYGILQALSHDTLWVESAAVVLILCPIFTRHARLAAIVLLPTLHLGFGLCLRLGVFAYAMMSFFPLLLAPEHWRWLERRPRGRAQATAATGGGEGRRQPIRAVARWALAVPREAAVLLLIAAAVGDVVNRNPAIPEDWRYRQPKLLSKIISYPRNHQHWRMYSPDPPELVHTLAVEARTIDGRLVDPYNEVAGRYPSLPESGPMPVRLGYGQLFSAYSYRVGRSWRPTFRSWILRYPKRTGRREDRVVSFEVYELVARIPPPGSDELDRIVRVRLLYHPLAPPPN